ncbi:MAG: biotin/lipoyl-binding protein, partial [Kordiimonas sp.]
MVQRWVKSRVLLPAVLSMGFAIVSYALIASTPESKKRKAEYIAPLVEVVDVKESTHEVVVNAQGLVGAAGQEIALKPQVSGRIEAVHSNFRPGALIPAGQIIVQIEKSDYEIALDEAAAKLAKAKASVALEKGQQQIAREEFELLGDDFDFDENSRALALRAPQLKQFEAEEAIAQSAYDRARLALERTHMRLPYDVLVLDTAA